MSAASPASDPFAPGTEALEAARLISGPQTWAERVADRLNPIFVKETRQALKSKQFVIAFLLLLAAGWITSVFAVLLNTSGLEYGNSGRELFGTYYVILSAAIVVVVPFGAFRSLLTEREDATFEPLVITTLKPRQIVVGKLLSSMLQTFLYYSAIAPFMAFTAMLQGFDIAYVSLMLLIGLGISLWVSMAALAVSAMVKGKVWQTVISLVVLGGLIWSFGITCALAFEPYWYDFSNREFWWVVGAFVVAGVTYLVLMQQIAVTNLTFDADNRSTGLRLICTGQFLLLWVGLIVSLWYFSSGSSGMRFDEEMVAVASVLSLLHWTVAGLFFVTEPPGLSQRIVRRLPRLAAARLLVSPFYPGGHRGLVYILAHLALLCIFATSFYVFYNVSDPDAVPGVLGALLYLVIYLNFAAMVARWGMAWSNVIQPIHARVIAILLVALSMIVPMFAMLFDNYNSWNDYSLLMVPSLPMTIEHLGRGGAYTESILTCLGIWALVMTAINLPAMLNGLREVTLANPGRDR